MIVFWSFWLVIGLALVVVFLCKVPSLLARCMIASVYGKSDFGVMTANLQDGASILHEPSSAASRNAARYQIYKRKSGKKFFIGEWKCLVEEARYSLFCYDSNDKLIDVIRVCERVEKKRFTNVTLLPFETDYVLFRLNRVDGVRVNERYGKMFFIWLALFALSCAAAVSAALSIIYAFVSLVVLEAPDSGWNYISLSVAIVFAIAAAAFAAISVCLLIRGKVKPLKLQKVKTVSHSGGGVFRKMFHNIKYFFVTAAFKIRNLWRLVQWNTPIRHMILRKNDAVPNERALKRLAKSKDKW